MKHLMGLMKHLTVSHRNSLEPCWWCCALKL